MPVMLEIPYDMYHVLELSRCGNCSIVRLFNMRIKTTFLFKYFHFSADTTDEEQSSDDEAPEEVSAAAATALAGRRRKAEQQARQAAPAPKRNKRARSSSSKGGKNASTSADVAAVAEGGGEGLVGGGGEIELPSDLLLKVKSGGLQRMEADVLAAREMKKQAEAASATALSAGRKVKKRAGDLPRR